MNILNKSKHKKSIVLLLISFILSNMTFAGWKEYSYPDGQFSIQFPTKPSSKIDGAYTILTSISGTTAHQVVYLPIDYDIAGSSEKVYAQSFGMYGTIQGEPESINGPNGLKGRKASIKNGSAIYNVIVWQTATRNWTLCIGKTSGKVPLEAQNNFFNSFKKDVVTSAVSSTSNQSNGSSNSNGTFDPYEYLKDMYFIRLENYDEIDDWKYPKLSDLTSHIENGYPDFKAKIEAYGEGTFQSSNRGKDALNYLNNEVPKLYPIIPQIVDKFLNAYEEKQQAEKNGDNFAKGMISGAPHLKYLKVLHNFVSDFYAISNDPAIKASADKVLVRYEKAIAEVDFINSDMHKTRLDQLVLYKGSPKIGEEKESDIENIVSWDKGQTMFAYWPKNLKGQKDDVKFTLRFKDQVFFYQELYFHDEMRKEGFKKLGHIRFDFFPNPDEIDYKTVYEYNPQINFLSYFSDQTDGIHELEFRIEAGNYAMEKTIRIEVNADTRSKMKALKEKLIQKKIDNTSLPICEDGSGIIANKDFFTSNGFGTLVKYVQTDPVIAMKDGKWPYPVIGHAAGGWGIVKQDDGSYELIRIGVTRKLGGQNWMASVSPLPTKYDMKGNKNYTSAIGNNGYIMRLENISKCYFWQCE